MKLTLLSPVQHRFIITQSTKGGLMPKVIKMGGIIHGIRIGEVGSNYDFGTDTTLQRATIS